MRERFGDPILAGVALREDDGAVLRFAGEIARVTGAPIVLLHAYPHEPSAGRAPSSLDRDVRAALDELAAPLRETTRVTLQVRPNPSPVRALHEAAEEVGAFLLVAGAAHDRHAAGTAERGVAERLLHAAPCAVAVVPRDRVAGGWALRRIGVAFIDGPEGADALSLAGRLARRAGARVHSYTVLGPPAPGMPGGAPPTGAPRGRDGMQPILDKVRAALPGDVLEATDVLEGDPAGELARVSAGLDLLICGSRGYGPVHSLLLGGVSATLAHTAACPLLVVPHAPVPGLRAVTGDPVARHGPA